MAQNKKRTPYLSLAITFTPTILIILTTPLLVFVHKQNVLVDAELTAEQVSFHVNEDTQELVASVPAVSVMLTNFKMIEFAVDRLTHGEETIQVEGTVFIRPSEDAQWPRVRFSGDEIRLGALDVAAESRIVLHTPEGKPSIDIEVNNERKEGAAEPSTGVISLGNTFTLGIERCYLTNEKGEILLHKDPGSPQKILDAFSSFEETSSFVGSDHGFHILLGMPEQETTGLFSVTVDGQDGYRVSQEAPPEDVPLVSNTMVRGIDLNYYDVAGDVQSTIRSGTVKFRNIRKEDVGLEEGDFIQLSTEGVFKIVELRWSPASKDLSAKFVGSIDSLKLGKGLLIEQLPSLLEWLYSDQRFTIIMGVLLFAVIQIPPACKQFVEAVRRALDNR